MRVHFGALYHIYLNPDKAGTLAPLAKEGPDGRRLGYEDLANLDDQTDIIDDPYRMQADVSFSPKDARLTIQTNQDPAGRVWDKTLLGLVLGHNGARLLVDVKGRRFPGRSQGKSRYTVDYYFFVPSSLGVNKHTYRDDQFFSDMQAYIRFKTPSRSLASLVGELSQRRLQRSTANIELIRGIRQCQSGHQQQMTRQRRALTLLAHHDTPFGDRCGRLVMT